MNGEGDDLPEGKIIFLLPYVLFFANNFKGAFYMVGDIDSARAKGEKILAELAGEE